MTQAIQNKFMGFSIGKFPTRPMPIRIDNFEALRGLLALWVLLIHIFANSGISFKTFGVWESVFEAVNAVDVFIMMSGFLIFRLLDVQSEPYMPYITRRFFRLFPAYFLCLCLVILLVNPILHALKAMPWKDGHVGINIALFESAKQFLPWHIMAHLTMLFGMIPNQVLFGSAYTLLGTAWSLSLEWQFYLIAPLIRSLISRKNWVITVLTFLMTSLLFIPFRSWSFMGFLPQKIPMFTLGILSFYSWKDSRVHWLLLLYAAGVFLFINKFPVIIWLAVFYMSYFQWNLLEKRTLLYLGKISYSIYISHMLPIFLCMMLLLHYHIRNQALFFELMVLLVVPITVLLSHLLYHYVEKPFIAYAKNITKPAPAPVLRKIPVS